MKTCEIFSSLLTKFNNDQSLIKSFCWNDLFECLNDNIALCQNVYSQSQYKKLTDLSSNTQRFLLTAVEQKDYSSVLHALSNLYHLSLSLPDTDLLFSIVDEGRFTKELLRHITNNTVVFIGDSHVNLFSGNEELTYESLGNGINLCPQANDFPITVIHCGPCLAFNSFKYNTTFKFKEKLEYLCNRFLFENDTVVISLGEIDLRAHVKKQASIQGIPWKAIIDTIIQNYFECLIELKKSGLNVYIWGPIASQPSNPTDDPVFPVSGTEAERNIFTQYFTNTAKLLCAQSDIGFISIFDKLVDSNMKTKIEYYSSDNVHLSQKVLPLVKNAFNEAGLFIFT